MTCEEFRIRLDAYVDGELTAQQCAALREHAAACELCREELKLAERLRKMTENMESEIMPPLPAQAAWRGAVRKEAKAKRLRKIYRIAGAAAAGLALLAGVTVLLRVSPRERVTETGPLFTFIATDGENVLAEEPVMAAGKMAVPEEIPWELTVVVENGQTDGIPEKIANAVRECGGDVENARTSAVNAYIPAEQKETFLDKLEQIGMVETVSETAHTSESIPVIVRIQ